MLTSQTISQKLRETAQAKVKNYPCNNIRASEIGHPCERYNVLSITNWEDKKEYDAGFQNIFDLGNALEAEVIRRIKEAGFETLTGTKNFKIQNPLITGREDIMLKDPDTGELFPCEIKGLSPTAWDKINSVEDMLNHKQYYIRKYPAQLQIYMLYFNKEKGFFLLFNKISGAIKVIQVSLDYEYCEGLLQKSERVYKHISVGTLPEIIDNVSVCEDCPLLHICGAKINKGDAMIDNGDLEKLLKEKEDLTPFVKKYYENKKQIKQAMKSCDRAFTANYVVTKKVIVRKPFVVAGTIFTKEVIRRIT